jgi:hypothetical protein
MPLQNRVTPGGELIATSARGTLMGNRGILHDDNKEIVRTSRNMMWLICRLEFKGRRRPLMSPGTYTELFFLDEAVALAAGHRPCGECRRSQYRSYMDAVNQGSEEPLDGPKELDRRLNESRRVPRTMTALATLPDGVFVTLGDDDFRLIWDGALHRWSPAGYVDAMAIDIAVESAEVVTPALSVAALQCGYPVEVHPSVVRGEAAPRQVGTADVGGRHPPRFATSEMCSTNAVNELLMTSLTPELLEEINRHLRVNPVRHGEVFRAMERGLDVDQMDTSRGNARNFRNSVEAMLTGTLPTTKSAALVNSYGYRYLLGCDLSPELRSHTTTFLRQLNAINPEVRINETLQIRALPGTTARRRADNRPAQVIQVCPQCNLQHAGECDY